ncbi:MAG: 4'-phosphopantetheinyl transferase superfamily protein [Acidisphaera sp.]|nr:4'-phosphopantetheinyl transferase superfamily protein [Acidisphaera sp.]
MTQEIAVFYTRVPVLEREAIGKLMSALSPSERQRAAGFAFDADRNAFVVAHALARRTLDRAPAQRPVRLSLSHSTGLAACAVAAADIGIGVDVEAIRHRPDLIAVAQNYFAESECRHLAALAPADQVRDFTRLWTLKEAAVKAAGADLTRGLQEFCFTLDPLALTGPADRALWHFAEFVPAPGHRAALALRGPPCPAVEIAWQEIDIASLV